MLRRSLVAGALALTLLAACTGSPTPAQIETLAMAAAQSGNPRAEAQLRNWAGQGLPVAQRELGDLLSHRSGQSAEGGTWLRRAAEHGDGAAAFSLAELERRQAGIATALPWYRSAAGHGHAQAALALALLYKNGTGVPLDMVQATRWLQIAADGGDGHALFLLSNAYADGAGVSRDATRARRLLERAADLEYPAALQQLALVKQTGDTLTTRDPAEASALLQEAAEHRRSNARRF